MSKWSGVGIPPTRKKLHKLRQRLVLERKADRKSTRAEAAALEASFRSHRRAIVNPERFEELWG
jgi:hypothetical protein